MTACPSCGDICGVVLSRSQLEADYAIFSIHSLSNVWYNFNIKSMTERFSIRDLITSAFSFSATKDKKETIADLTKDIVLSPTEAVSEIMSRQGNTALRRKVEEYLKGDIPEYFKEGPVLYLARHIATPNFETLRFVHITEPLGMKTVVSQDTKDLFVSRNHEKRGLGKLSVCKRISKNGNGVHELCEHVSVIDFNKAEGNAFNTIETTWGESLVDFHSALLKSFINGRVETPDDAAWIDRHDRGNLHEHFRQFLPLFLVHGVFFEDYVHQDRNFVKNILRPAFQYTEERFGYRPIIARLTPDSIESDQFWISYPTEVSDIIRDKMKGKKKNA